MRQGSADLQSLKARGMQCVSEGRLTDAAEAFTSALALATQDVEVTLALGIVKGMLGDYPDAERHLLRAVELAPGLAAGYYNLGLAQKSQGRLREAVASYRKAVEIEPGQPEFHNNLGSVYLELGDVGDAVECFNAALALNPSAPEYHYNLGKALKARGLRREAVEAFRAALRLQPDFHAVRVDLGSVLLSLGDVDAAQQCLSEAVGADPGNPEAVAGLAGLYMRTRQYERARALLRSSASGRAPGPAVAIVSSDLARHEGRTTEAIGLLEQQLEGLGPGRRDIRAQLHFRLGHLYDETGAFDTAFDHFRRGNELRRQPFALEDVVRRFDEVSTVYDAGFLGQATGSGNDSEVPVFIVGMPRSGTSLVEQVLAAHPRVHGAGELDEIPALLDSMPDLAGTGALPPGVIRALGQDDLAALARRYLAHVESLAPDADRITDKMPSNFQHLGFIQLLFPKARIIHCRRDPMDTCLSCYFQDFSGHHPYATDLEATGAYHRAYQRLMQHWAEVLKMPMLEIDYERLVDDFEPACREMIDFCGLEWHDACLDFHRSKRLVVTASSEQVNRPLYSASVGRWRNYEDHLSALKKALSVNSTGGSDRVHTD